MLCPRVDWYCPSSLSFRYSSTRFFTEAALHRLPALTGKQRGGQNRHQGLRGQAHVPSGIQGGYNETKTAMVTISTYHGCPHFRTTGNETPLVWTTDA